MSVGIITGSGTYALPGFLEGEPIIVHTPFGDCEVISGIYGGVEALHVSRHRAGHVRLSNHVTHRADIWALKELEASAVIGCTACGAVDPTLELGSLVVFDDLHFISNRLPDGSLSTFFVEPEVSIEPRTGMALLFQHPIVHEGSEVTAGVKYVVRTDLMYRRPMDADDD